MLPDLRPELRLSPPIGGLLVGLAGEGGEEFDAAAPPRRMPTPSSSSSDADHRGACCSFFFACFLLFSLRCGVLQRTILGRVAAMSTID